MREDKKKKLKITILLLIILLLLLFIAIIIYNKNINMDPKIILDSDDNLTVNLGDSFDVPIAIGEDYNGNKLDVKITIKLNGKIVDKVDTNQVGEYTVEYSVTDSKINKTVTKVIIVVVKEKDDEIPINDDKHNIVIKDVLSTPSDITSEDVNVLVKVLNNTDDLIYSFDNGQNWQKSDTFVVSDNTTLKIIVKDSYGNSSEVYEKQITNIDKISPTFSVSQNKVDSVVALTINANDNKSGIKDYSFDGGLTWQSENSKSFSKNQIVSVKVRDNVLNESEEQKINITSIESAIPVINNVVANTDNWTTQDVVLTVSASSNSTELFYSFDNGSSWQSSNSYTVKQNGVFNVIVKDVFEHKSSVYKKEVKNIDKTAPTFYAVQNVFNNRSLVVVNAEDVGSGIKDYSFDNGITWQTQNTKEFNQNQTLNILVRDNVLNVSEVQTVEITDINNNPPIIENVTSDTIGWTNHDVKITVSVSNYMGDLLYSFDNGVSWQSSNIYTAEENKTLYIVVKDSRNILSDVVTISVDNIDKIAPTIYDVQNSIGDGKTSDRVQVTIISDDGESGIKEYSFDNGVTWQSQNSIYVTENKIIKARVRDNVGNTSGTRELEVNSIDKDAPDFTVSGNPDSWQTEDVILSVNATDLNSGLADEPYSFDGGFTWQSSNSKIFTENQVVTINVKDAVENISDPIIVEINKIDKVKPIVESIFTNDSDFVYENSVVINAIDNESGIKEYSFDGGLTWQSGNSKTITENKILSIKVRDNTGNESDNISVTISNIDINAPVINSITGNPTEWTNQNVVLKVEAEDIPNISGIYKYSFDAGNTWIDSNEYTVLENSVINVCVKDKAGNVSSINAIDVNKIDKIAPNLNLSANTEEWTKNNVKITANANDDLSGVKEYSFDNGLTWQTDNFNIYHENGTFSILARDNVLNQTTPKQIVISNIDTDSPSVVSVDGNPTEWTKNDVVLSLRTIDNLSGIKAYSFNSGITWQDENKKDFNQNQEVSIKIKDNAENVSDSIDVEITKIDKEIPVIDSIIGNVTAPTNKAVTLIVKASDALSGIKEYSFDGGLTWQTSDSKTFESNQEVKILVKDNAGNISISHTEIIDKIIKVTPEFTVYGNPTNWIHDDAIISIVVTNVGAGLADAPYSFDNGVSWQAENYITVAENKAISIRVRDKAGNITPTSIQNITKIDKSGPQVIVTGNQTEWTNKVTLTLQATDDISGVKDYSFDGGLTWQATNTKEFEENGIVKIVVRDNALNKSQTYEEIINKIDIQAPDFNVTQSFSEITKRVSLTIQANDTGSGVKDYSFDGGLTWQADNIKEFDKNQTVNICVRDNALNNSDILAITITNIDDTKPVIDSITGNSTEWTNENVTLFVTAHDDNGIKEYSFDNGVTWIESNSYTFNSNQDVNILVKDVQGNTSDISNVRINKIDKLAPEFDIIGNVTEWTPGNVKITINATDDLSGVKEYQFEENGTWQSSNSYTYTKDGIYSIKVKDNALNITTDEKMIIVKIDTDSPSVLNIEGNVSEWTNQDVTLIVSSIDTGAGIKEYSFDEGTTWQEQNSKTFSENQIVSVQIKDNVDNITDPVIVNIEKIDKNLPQIQNVSGNSVEETNNTIKLIVDATDNESGIYEYSFDNGITWQVENSKDFDTNQTVNIKVRDRALNESAVHTEIIDKIDKTAPTFTVSGNPTNWQYDDATLVINAVDNGFGLADEPYSFDGGMSWQSQKSIVIDSNQTINVKVKDKAGNFSEVEDINVSKIDKDVPIIRNVLGNSDTYVNKVELKIDSIDELSGVKEYSFDDGSTWQTSNSKEYTSNQSVIVKVKDNVGNISDPYEVNITKIDRVAPTFELGQILSSDSTTSTINITAQDDVSGIKDYSFNGGYSWQEESKKEYTSNQVVNIKVRDKAGNISEIKSIEVTGIDDIPPVILDITGNSTTWTNHDITLTVNAVDNESGIKEYSFDGGKFWTESNSFIFNSNTTSVIYVKDKAGNISEAKTVVIDKIDKIAPTFKIVSDKTKWGVGQVTVKIEAIDNEGGSGVAEYLFDENSTWQTSSTYTYTQNGQYSLHVKDKAGNVTTETKMIIIKIDTEAPSVLSVEGNPTEWTNKDVILTINTIDEGSGISRYSFDNGITWQDENKKTFTTNQEVNILIQDNAENVTETINVKIDKIDKVVPVINSVSGNVDSPTNNTVTLSVDATDDLSGMKEYSFDSGKTWQKSSEKTFDKNGTYLVIAKDEASNLSNPVTIVIDKIDSTPPNIISVDGNATDWALNVTLNVNAIDDGLGIHDTEGYSFDDGLTWQQESSKLFENNTSVYIKVKDKAGNISKTHKVLINKIDNIPPVLKLKDGIDLKYEFGLNKNYQFGITDITASDNAGEVTTSYKIIKDDIEEIFSSSEQDYNTKDLEKGKYTIRYIATDKVGLTSTIERIIIIDPNIVGANEPELQDGMIPIKWDIDKKTWIKADAENIEESWYSYDRKLWANAVLVKQSGIKSRDYYMEAGIGTPILESDILAYLVWIPRFKYKISEGTGFRTVDIKYEYLCNTTGVDSNVNGAGVTEYYTHPSFDFGGEQLTGYWMSKFRSTGSLTSITSKPNLTSIRSTNISQFFNAMRNMQVKNNMYGLSTSMVDTHLIKGIDAAAISYLSASQFGINKNITANASYTTGAGNYITNVAQSTTGNITGIYDMSTSAMHEFVMSNNSKKLGSSGFSILPDEKYYDLYNEGSATDYTRSILGDATGETSKFVSGNHNLPYSTNSFMLRGYSSAFNSTYYTGAASTTVGARFIITPSTMILKSNLLDNMDEGTDNIISLNDVEYKGQGDIHFNIIKDNEIIYTGNSNDQYNLKDLIAGKYKIEYTNQKGTSKCIRNINIIEGEVLNAPELDANMIPIKWDGAKWVKANSNSKADWYSYKDKLWANAVLVKDKGINTREYYLSDDAINKEVLESDILAYLVWIPRYKYKIPDGSGFKAVDIKFEKGTQTTGVSSDTLGAAVIEYYTHPSFTFGGEELQGYWVGKFKVTGSLSTLTIKPNLTSIRSTNISQFFNTSRQLQKEGNIYGLSTTAVDSHLTKGIDDAAISYLSASQYGINKNMTASTSYVTGAGNYTANVAQSTTGNTTGIYDMSNSAMHEFAMSNNSKQLGSSGFSILPDEKYYDLYEEGAANNYARSILGDATKETSGYVSGNHNLPYATNSFMLRGYPSTFNSTYYTGAASATVGARVIITSSKMSLKNNLINNMDAGTDNIVSINDVTYKGQDELKYKIFRDDELIYSGNSSAEYNLKQLEAGRYRIEYSNSNNTAKCTRNLFITESENLNAPILDINMIPIKWDGAKWVKANASSKTDWYSYKDQSWANAVLVKASGTKTRDYYLSDEAIGKEVYESDILAYYVWIPRFKYKISTGTGFRSIDIKFEKGTETTGVSASTNGAGITEYYTHPSFDFGGEQLKGYWIGKFKVTGSLTSMTIKPNLTSIRSSTISQFFTYIKQMQNQNNIYGLSTNTVDTHLIKGIDAAAVSYLSASQYGINKNITANTSYTTGAGNYIANIVQSTTGNITGIYDMSNSSMHEYVMSNSSKYLANSGFAVLPDEKYYDLYQDGVATDYTRSILGDATKETSGYVNGNHNLPYGTNSFMIRGYSSTFNSTYFTGAASSTVGARAIIVPSVISLKTNLVNNMDAGTDNIVSLNNVNYVGQDLLSFQIIKDKQVIFEGTQNNEYNLKVLTAGKYTVEYINQDKSVRCVRDVTINEIEDANVPELDANMIPIKWDGAKWVKANNNSTTDWYSYKDKKWANAVLVKASGTKTRAYYLSDEAIGKEVYEADILTYLVWIPRYKYRIPVGSGLRTIDIKFEKGTETTGVNSDVEGAGITEYYTHPSFDFGGEQLRGYWVGKFKTTGSVSALTIKPNLTSLRTLTVSQIFNASRQMQNTGNVFGLSTNMVDTHITKGIDNGAIAYLATSEYGTNKTITANSSHTTGAGNYISNINQTTTGNITGIYDMYSTAGYEQVMSNNSNQLGTSGFGILPDKKYYDLYKEGTATDYTRSILGDATVETKDFGGTVHNLPYGTNAWMIRGYSSMFNSTYHTGAATSTVSSRIIITPSKITLRSDIQDRIYTGTNNLVSLNDINYIGQDSLKFSIKSYNNELISSGSGNETYNLSNLTSGKYIIEYYNSNETVKLRRIVEIVDKEQVNEPELDVNMIPIKWDGAKWIKVNLDNLSDWYSYKDKMWANAVLVKANGTKTREYYLSHESDDKEVYEADILAYLVWVPRFKYKIPVGTSFRTIDIEFEKGTETTGVQKDTEGAGVTEYYTHPSFTFGDKEISGFWAGKYKVTGSVTSLTIKPNLNTIRSVRISQFFDIARQMQNQNNIYGLSTNNIDSHVIKGIDNAAIAYLSASQYGTNKAMTANTTNTSGAGNYISNVNQSTTGNITGIYDMSSSAMYEAVMSNSGRQVSSSGFTVMPDEKYYDAYVEGTPTDMSRSILGDGTKETSNFVSGNHNLPYNPNNWMIRGLSSVFNSTYYTGSTSTSVSTRIVITP